MSYAKKPIIQISRKQRLLSQIQWFSYFSEEVIPSYWGINKIHLSFKEYITKERIIYCIYCFGKYKTQVSQWCTTISDLFYLHDLKLIFFVTYQAIPHYIDYSTPQNFTNIYLLITYRKPILTFETADSKTLLIQPGLLLASSVPKGRDPNSAKLFKTILVQNLHEVNHIKTHRVLQTHAAVLPH